MIKLVATATHISNGEYVHLVEYFNEAEAAELVANECVADLRQTAGVVDYHVIISDECHGDALLHLCLDDAQPYYEHRMGWRDNFDVARFVNAKRRSIINCKK